MNMEENVARLGEVALKLEKYRYNIMLALSWVIFGMLFGSVTVFYNSNASLREWIQLVNCTLSVCGRSKWWISV